MSRIVLAKDAYVMAAPLRSPEGVLGRLGSFTHGQCYVRCFVLPGASQEALGFTCARDMVHFAVYKDGVC